MPSENVLVVTLQYAPDFGPSAPIYTALCEDLVRMGYNVTVITGFPNYDVHETDPKYAGKLFAEENINGVRVIRTYVYTVPKKALWRRLLYHGSFNLLATLAELRLKKPDVIMADAPTLWSGLPLFIGSALRKVPFIYIIHDIYPDVLERLGYLNNPRILNLVGRLEKYFYHHAHKITVISQGFKENLLRKGVPAEKIEMIPICTDVEFIHPLPRQNALREQWGLNGKFVVLYAGNIGLSQGLETAVEAAERLAGCPEIAFVFVGAGATKAALQSMAEEKHLTNVKFFPFQPREDVPQVYALADISLVSLKPEIVAESVPSKTYSIMASQRPIVATVDPSTEVGRLLTTEAKCGICIQPGDPDALAKAILSLYEDQPLAEEMGKTGRAYVVDHYSRQVAAQQYHGLIQGITKHFTANIAQTDPIYPSTHLH